MGARRRAAAAVAALALVLGVTGCSRGVQRTDGSNVTARYVDLPDGSQVVCVFWISTTASAAGGGSIECDFGAER
jgi:hypothetical protein